MVINKVIIRFISNEERSNIHICDISIITFGKEVSVRGVQTLLLSTVYTDLGTWYLKRLILLKKFKKNNSPQENKMD